MSASIAVSILVPGEAAGETFVLGEPLSFWGGLEASTGRIIDQWHGQKDQVIANRILVMRSGRGSSSGSSVLAEAIRLGRGPAGIVLMTRDAIVTTGAMIASELYNIPCPVVMVQPEDWPLVARQHYLAISAPDRTDASGSITFADV